MKLHPKVTDARAKQMFLNLENDFRKVHLAKYDYKNSIYQSTHKKIEIICPEHGSFEQSPSTHKKGVGCPKCAKENSKKANLLKSKKAKESFVEKAEIIHFRKYDYCQTNYQRTHSKVIIICPDHGLFEQTPAHHLSGKGCPLCGINKRQKGNERRSKLAAEQFVLKAEKKHGKRYNYDRVVYKTSNNKVIIKCPIHGDFNQAPSKHLMGNGCTLCGRISNAKKLNEVAAKRFVNSVREIHKNKYLYSQVIYKTSHSPVKIICPTHGPFEQSPTNHLAGKGCIDCGRERTNIASYNRSDIAKIEFRNKANDVHNFKYDYSSVDYKSSSDKITIICKDHGEFIQTPNSHIRGSDCPNCADSGFDPDKPALLYYLKVCGGIAFKIGITNRSVEDRFGSDMSKINILKTWEFETGADARAKENLILQEFKYAKWTGPNILKDGNSELFDFDVLDLDIED